MLKATCDCTLNLYLDYNFIFFLKSQDQEQSTPLHAAAYMGDVIVMDLLISSGKRQKELCGCKNKIFVVMTDIN